MKHFRVYTICLLTIAFLFCSFGKQVYGQVVANVTIGGSTGAISKNIWGVDFQSLTPVGALEPDTFFANYINAGPLQNLGAQLYRFPGGCAADSYDSQTGFLIFTNAAGPVNRQYFTIPQALSIANSSGGELLFQVNINGTEIVGNPVANVCGETSQVGKTTAQLLTDINTFITTYPNIQYFELGNSQWFNWAPDVYIAQAIQFARAIKALKPTATIGLVGYPSYLPASQAKIDWTTMIQQNLPNTTCGPGGNTACFDFVTDHHYPQAKSNTQFPGQASYFSITNQTQLPGFMATATSTGKQYGVTEWNLSCGDPPPNPRVGMTNSVDHGIFTFTTLFMMAKSKVSMANYHDLTVNVNPATSCGLFSDPATLTATGQAFSLSSVAAGGELYNADYVFPNNDGIVQLPANTGCNDADCLQPGAQGNSIMSSYAVRKGNDLYIFLVNRSDAGDAANAKRITANIAVPIWAGYTPRTIDLDQYWGLNYFAQTFSLAQTQLPNQSTGIFQATLLPTSITRIKIPDHFLGAPAATPTSGVIPSLNLTTIQKFINSKRRDIPPCSPDILMFIIAAAVYIMIIRFAIAMNEDFKLNIHVTCFIIGGVVGYYVCQMEAGFVLAVVLSLFLW